MGFFILSKTAIENIELIKNVYLTPRGIKQIHFKNFGKWKLIFAGKTFKDIEYHYSEGSSMVILFGTYIYKKMFGRNGLKLLLKDFIEKKISFEELNGVFTIILHVNNKIYFLRDKSNLNFIYYDKSKSIISSSFIVTSELSRAPLTINKEAILENLLTGAIVGNNTIFNEIKKINDQEPSSFEEIDFIIPNEIIYVKKSSFETEVKKQLFKLEEYFRAIKPLADYYGTDCGLTGGYDSRLLFILARKHFKNVQAHSFWRKNEDLELKVARSICKQLKIPLKVVTAKHPFDMTNKELLETIQKSFVYLDGQVCLHAYWHEMYNTYNYRKKVVNDKLFGLHGIGGEQYRNAEKIFLKKRNFYKWVKYELIYKRCGDPFTNKEAKKDFLKYISEKTANLLNLNNKNITQVQIKQYYNEVYNPSLRGIRTNYENTDMFFVSPFAEYRISQNAYSAIPQLGLSGKFQQEMIKKLNPDIAKIKSDYGFDFYNREPFYRKLATIIKDTLPPSLYFSLYVNRKQSHNDRSFLQFESKFLFIQEYIKQITNLDLPIDLEKLKTKSDLYPLIWSMGYLLNHFKNKKLL
jgi:hypothetical protein